MSNKGRSVTLDKFSTTSRSLFTDDKISKKATPICAFPSRMFNSHASNSLKMMNLQGLRNKNGVKLLKANNCEIKTPNKIKKRKYNNIKSRRNNSSGKKTTRNRINKVKIFTVTCRSMKDLNDKYEGNSKSREQLNYKTESYFDKNTVNSPNVYMNRLHMLNSDLNSSQTINKDSKVVMKNPLAIRIFESNSIAIELMKFLNYYEYCSFMVISKKVYNKKLIKKALYKLLISGLNKKQQIQYWRSKCNIKENNILYQYYCKIPSKFEREIINDVIRTSIQSHTFTINTDNYNKLFRVLNAFAIKHPEIGYVQGLNFLAGNLILLFSEQVYMLYHIVCFLGS